jgi:hypothetical protein
MCKYSDLTVCRSAAGWYIGRVYVDPDGWEMPGSRESEYYPTLTDAEDALMQGFTLRVCDENLAAFVRGEIPTQPGSFYRDEDFWKKLVSDCNTPRSE